MKDNYKQWLEELATMPGVEEPPLDPEKMLFLDAVEDVPGFSKSRVLAALKIKEIAFDMHHENMGEVHGYSDDKTLAIRRSTPYPTAVLWHELGHILCKHHKRFAGGGKKEPTRAHLGQAEAEAMSVAYLLCNVYHYNPPKPHMRWYVQNWYKGKKITAESAKYIMAAADKIIEANGYKPE